MVPAFGFTLRQCGFLEGFDLGELFITCFCRFFTFTGLTALRL